MPRFKELTPNQRKSLDGALKHVERTAVYLGLSFDTVCELLVERACTRQWGGARAGAGRPPTDWSLLTGNHLPGLPLRLVIQKALHEARFDDELSDFEAFRQTLPPDFSKSKARRLYRSMREALENPPQTELDRYKEQRKLRRLRRANGENQDSD